MQLEYYPQNESAKVLYFNEYILIYGYIGFDDNREYPKLVIFATRQLSKALLAMLRPPSSRNSGIRHSPPSSR